MGKILVIAEKPSVGRDIARVLKCTVNGEGFLSNDLYIVSWAIGHLVSLLDPEEYDVQYKKWQMETLPIIPQQMKLKVLPKTRIQFTVLKKLMNDKSVDSFICATDSGREGELIFRYIYQMAGTRKPFQRLWISSMTDEAIREGFAGLKPGSEYDALYESARCRSEADWLVGMNASRAFTIMYKALLSVGRVQTPTLAILVARHKEIEAFVPQDYWEIHSNFGNYRGVWFDKAVSETKLFDKEKAAAIARKVKGRDGFIQSVGKEEKKQLFPQLYDLTELQRDANRRYGFSAQRTLKTAQELYEKRKMITYPRTDSRHITQDMIPTLKTILQTLDRQPYSEFVKPVLALAKLPLSKRLVDNSKVSDHHAIIPTKTRGSASLSEDERKIYDLIARRFLAAFYPPYEYEETQIRTCVEDETFYTKGIAVKSLGWKVLYDQAKDSTDSRKNAKESNLSENGTAESYNEEAPLPDLAEGQKVTAETVKVLSKKTVPPKPYTDASLLSAMEHAGRFVEDEELKEQLKDNGLGTPATRAATIERLIQVGYVNRKGRALLPTEKGINLIEIVPDELKSPETTGKWERALANIAKNTMQPDRFIGSIVRYVDYIVKEAAAHRSSIVFPQEPYRGKKKSYPKRPADTAQDKNTPTRSSGRGRKGAGVKKAENGKT
jgi:DNA topoisomerase-3